MNNRLLLVSPFFPPCLGGVEIVAANLASFFQGSGYQVDVLTGRLDEREHHSWNGATIIEHSGHPSERSAWPLFRRDVRMRIESGRYSACILFADPDNWTWWSLESIDVPGHTRIIVQPVINDHGYARWRQNTAYATRAAMVLANPAIDAVTCSRTGVDVEFCLFAGKVPAYIPNSVHEIPNANGHRFRSQWDIGNNTFVILHVANLWPVKNHDGLLHALHDLSEDTLLVLIGHPSSDEGYVAKVRDMADQNPRVLLIEGLPRESVADAFAAANLVILSSHGDIAPLVILEAMLHATPWLATPRCGAVHERSGGVIAPLEDFPKLIRSLKKNPGLSARLARAGHKHFTERHDWKRISQAWKQLVADGDVSVDFSTPVEAWEETLACRNQLLGRDNSRPNSPPVHFGTITAGKRRRHLVLQVASIHAQGIPDPDILVAGDVPSGLDRIKAFPMQAEAEAGRLSTMRNALLDQAGRGIFVFLDDDILLKPGFVPAVRECRLRGHDMVGCCVLNPDGSRYWDWAKKDRRRQIHRLLDYAELDRHLYTSGLHAVDSSVAKAIRWDESLTFYEEEDVDFSYRLLSAGHSMGSCPAATAIHMDPRYTRVGDKVIRFTDLKLKEFVALLCQMLLYGDIVRSLRTLHVWAYKRRSRYLQKLARLGLIVAQASEAVKLGLRSRLRGY